MHGDGNGHVSWAPQCKYGYGHHLYMSLKTPNRVKDESPYLIASETKKSVWSLKLKSAEVSFLQSVDVIKWL